MIIKIAIADSNEEYVERLLNVLSGYDDLNLSVYTERYALEQALASKKFDVLLFDPSVYQGQLELGKDMVSVMMLDENADIPECCKAQKKVKKFQRISKIYQQILELYSEVCGDTGAIWGTGKTKVVSVYSPIGGVGKTTIALAIATRLAMQGKNTFYMSFEDIASEDSYLAQSAERGLSEVASYLGADINFTMKIQSLLQTKRDGLYYLNHFDSPNDVFEMSADEVSELITQVQNTGLFDAIIIDTGVSMNQKLLKIFEASDRIVLVEKSDDISLRKMKCFFEQTHIINEYGRKMNRVLNFNMGHGSKLSVDVPLVGQINAVQNPAVEQLVTMMAGDSSCSFATSLLL